MARLVSIRRRSWLRCRRESGRCSRKLTGLAYRQVVVWHAFKAIIGGLLPA